MVFIDWRLHNSLIAPEDRGTFLDGLTHNIFGNVSSEQSELSQILKVSQQLLRKFPFLKELLRKFPFL